jgi:hypothetical protein
MDITIHENVLSDHDIVTIINDSTVQSALKAVNSKPSGQQYFSIELADDIKKRIGSAFGFDLLTIKNVPMRWIKGDTLAHTDTGKEPDFKKTHILYVSECSGDFILGDDSFEIGQNRAFIFNEGLVHETRNTNESARLLVGPMDEFGNPVGFSNTFIQADGATQSVYIRENSGNIEYSTDNLTWNNATFPIGIENTNTASATYLKVLFTNNITLSSTLDYFYCYSDYIQFGSDSLNGDGSRPEITINNVTNYPGLILNGDSGNNGYSYIKVLNLKVLSTGTTTLSSDAGWIGRSYFAKGATNNFIINCYSDGVISSNGGGIVGARAGIINGNLSIINCNSTGIISGSNSGGIAGGRAGEDGTIVIRQCSSSGNITGFFAGGIFGQLAGISSSGVLDGSATAIDCYSSGNMTSSDSGGIFGVSAANTNKGNAAAINCYSRGSIGGLGAGGIFARLASSVAGGIASAINCYTTGNITSAAGGIFGTGHGTINTLVFAINCYTTGTCAATNRGIYANGATLVQETTGNNYAESRNSTSGWNTTNANTALTGEPTTSNVGTTWVKTGVNLPYELKAAGFSPYSLNNISGTTLNTTYTETLAVGATSAASVVGSSFSITDINGSLPSVYSTITIDGTTGAITVGAGTVPDTYVLLVNCTINPYAYSTVTLTVSSAPLTTDCCISLKDMKYLTAETVTTVRAGNNIVAVAITNPKNKFRSYDSYLRYKTTAASKKRN